MTNYWLKEEIPVPEIPEFPKIVIPAITVPPTDLDFPPIFMYTPFIDMEKYGKLLDQ